MKLCKHCKWFVRGPFDVRLGECWHPLNLMTNPVDGDVERIWEYASTVRLRGSKCGPDGVLFEAAPPPQRLIQAKPRRWWEFWK